MSTNIYEDRLYFKNKQIHFILVVINNIHSLKFKEKKRKKIKKNLKKLIN